MNPALRFFQPYPPRYTKPFVQSDFPRWVTDPIGKRCIVQNPVEYETVMGIPWGASETTVCAAAPSAPIPEIEPDEKAQLIAYAASAGVSIDRRWGINRLKKAIADHQP